MSKFPLYTFLSTDIKNKDLTLKQKDDFIKKITQIDAGGIELVYALILYHAYITKPADPESTPAKCDSDAIPYEGIKQENSDVEFNLEKLPIFLRQLLYKFLDVHLTKLTEDSTMKTL